MIKTRILLLLVAAVLVILIFYLPKVVVDNDPNEQVAGAEPQSTTSQEVDVHIPEISTEDQDKIDNLKENLRVSENNEKSIIFADSLAKLYLGANKFDSAAKFIEIIAEKNPTEENFLRVGNTYYEAYGFAMDAKKQQMLGEKAREYFDKVLETKPGDLEIKNKIAMTYLTTANPMQGIMMLREILEQDSENQSALFNLGVLSMQSGQYDKAVERFLMLVELNPSHTQGQFFLGVSYLQTGQKDKAKQQFELVKKLDNDPAVQATVDSYLEDIN